MAVVAAWLAATGLVADARAGVVINITEVGSDVVAAGGGTLNLGGLTYSYSGGNYGSLSAASAVFVTGAAYAYRTVDVYTSITGPASFGPGGDAYPTSGSGDVFAIHRPLGYLEVPTGYRSGDSLSGSSTYANATFVSLGLTPGTYTWIWGQGADADFFTINIGLAPVPEPSSLVLSAVAVAGAAARLGGRNRRAKGETAR